jgi:hypothetical protein
MLELVGAHHVWWLLLQAWFMIARALPATITNAVSAINKGVFFMTTSLLRAPSIHAQMLSVVQNEPAMGGSGGV